MEGPARRTAVASAHARGQVVVFGLVFATLGIAGAAWLFQNSLMSARARKEPPPETAPPPPQQHFERRPAPGGVPAEPVETEPVVAAAPGAVPAVWAEKNNAAIEALQAGDHDRAIAGFEECRAEYPELAVFSANLAEALVRAAVREHARDAQCNLCLERLERAIAPAPERTDLPGLLERWKRERAVEGEFWHESSQHFALSYDGQRRDLLWGSTRLFNELEKAYADLGELFGIYPVESGRPKFRANCSNAALATKRSDFGCDDARCRTGTSTGCRSGNN